MSGPQTDRAGEKEAATVVYGTADALVHDAGARAYDYDNAVSFWFGRYIEGEWTRWGFPITLTAAEKLSEELARAIAQVGR